MTYETITVSGPPIYSHPPECVLDGVCTVCKYDPEEPERVVVPGPRCEMKWHTRQVTADQLDRVLNKYTGPEYGWTFDRQTGDVGQFEVKLRFKKP